MLVDPRPYTYQYRKPRLSNPTLQFFPHLANQKNLYESIYHTRAPHMYSTPMHPIPKQASNSYFPPENNEYRVQRQSSQVKPRPSFDYNMPVTTSRPQKNPQREDSNVKLPTINKRYELPAQINERVRANMVPSERDSVISRRSGFERFRIYQSQQKPFNIISCYPKQQEFNHLRAFPKLTLEDKLRERGTYHNLNGDL